MPLEGGTLQKAELTHFPPPSSTCMACWHVLLLGPCSYPESFSGLKLLKKIFPLLHKLNQVNEHASQMLFSSFPPHHGDSWAGTGQCHSTEVSGMMPIYISWWFEPLSLWHTSFPPSLDIKQSLEHVEVKTPTAGLNSHFHPCSCTTTVQVLQKPLQSGHVSKAGWGVVGEKNPARTSTVNRYQQAATVQQESRWGSAYPQLFQLYFSAPVSTRTATRKIWHAEVGKSLSEGTFLVKRSSTTENSGELLAEVTV